MAEPAVVASEPEPDEDLEVVQAPVVEALVADEVEVVAAPVAADAPDAEPSAAGSEDDATPSIVAEPEIVGVSDVVAAVVMDEELPAAVAGAGRRRACAGRGRRRSRGA